MSEPGATPAAAPQWRPLSATDRRVLGVLVEKAKTTPDVYPMSVAALTSGCNQKNNRYPLMELQPEDVEEALARLRAVGAATEIQGGGRVARFKHYLYEWMGVDKGELAVMAELLLRGTQTEGELRGRVARMHPLADLAALRPILNSLIEKKLVLSLTPEGRGHMVTHALYEPRELEKIRAEHHASAEAAPIAPSPRPAPAASAPPSAHHSPPASVPHAAPAPSREAHVREPDPAIHELRAELAEVREELASLRREFNQLAAQLR